MRKTFRILLAATFVAGALVAGTASAADEKARFYDFSDQLIDGEIKKPTVLVMEQRTRARFGKLLKLKKSFRPAMLETSKERILK